MSRTPNSRKEETHERIVDAAARAIHRHGYAGVGVADVMKEAGLTHGGFYAHFDSREAMLAEALERAGAESLENLSRAAQAGRSSEALEALGASYLSDTHLCRPEGRGTPAPPGSESPRHGPPV